MSLRDAQTIHVSDMLAVFRRDSVIVLFSAPKGLFTWGEGAPANRATRLTELPWAD